MNFLGVGRRGKSDRLPLPSGGGNIFQAPISNIKRLFHFFSVQFSSSACFLLNLFLHFKPLQIVLLTSCCGAGRREIRRFVGGRVLGIAPSSLRSFYYTLSKLRGIKKTHNCTPYAKWGVVRSPSERNLPQQSSPHSWSSKNRYRCALYSHQGLDSLLLHQA